MKFKTKQNSSVVIEVKMELPLEGADSQRGQRISSGLGNIRYLDLNGGYLGETGDLCTFSIQKLYLNCFFQK